MNPELVDKTTLFDTFLRGPSRRGISSGRLGWKGFVIEEHSTDAGEHPEAVSDQHFIGMWRHATDGEYANERGAYIPYAKHPGVIAVMPQGIIPAVRPRRRNEMLVCAFDPGFVNGVREELDRRPRETLHFETGIYDAPLQSLMTLLSEEAACGGPLGPLYADHLAQALVTRLLFWRSHLRPSAQLVASALPRHLLQRVIERMRELEADLDLQSLAAETGYSRGHFQRMFRVATGHTPHRYLLQLRLSRAQELLELGRMSLIDIAAACGFSSQSHMTTIFRQLLGVTPAQYRRGV
jgi:AraC family transcriptional regulator